MLAAIGDWRVGRLRATKRRRLVCGSYEWAVRENHPSPAWFSVVQESIEATLVRDQMDEAAAVKLENLCD